MVSKTEKSIVIPERSVNLHDGHPVLQSFVNQEKLSADQGSVFATGSISSKFALIDLKADSKGFGFNIVGGKDSPHIPGHSGIFVSIIKQDGPAHNDGRLSVGDLILSINGIDLVNKTHDEAVSIFRSQTGVEAQLLVEVAAEDRILSEHFTTDTRISAGKSLYEDSTELHHGSMTPAVCGKDITRLTTAPLFREEARGHEEDDESNSSCTPSIHSYLDDVPRTPKRPMSYFDPRNPSIVTEVLYVSIGLAVISLGVYIGYRLTRSKR